MRNEKNILLHELIGLNCEVVGAENASQMGLCGRIIDETMKTIVIKTASGDKKIPKKGSVLRIELGKNKIDIKGDFIVVRPEDRIKKKVKKW